MDIATHKNTSTHRRTHSKVTPPMISAVASLILSTSYIFRRNRTLSMHICGGTYHGNRHTDAHNCTQEVDTHPQTNQPAAPTRTVEKVQGEYGDTADGLLSRPPPPPPLERLGLPARANLTTSGCVGAPSRFTPPRCENIVDLRDNATRSCATTKLKSKCEGRGVSS